MNKNYTKSNETITIRLNAFKSSYSKDILECNEEYYSREKVATKLLKYLCDKFKINDVSLSVLNKPRLKKGSGEVYGKYQIKSKHIIIYNLTAKTQKPTSIKSFYDTLLHEFIHHYDFEVLKLTDSPHTKGFYQRINDLKAKLT
jgi:hypothetical protein